MLNENRHTNNNLHRQSSVPSPRNSFPPPTKLSRANTMKPILEGPSHVKRNHTRRLNHTKDEDIPLALLAYKKGYTTIYPIKPTPVAPTRQDERLLSFVSTSSSNSSTPSKPIIRHPRPSSKKIENNRNMSSPQRKKSSRTHIPIEPQQDTVIIKETKPKKWFNSIRKLL